MNGKVIINKELCEGFISLLRERFYNIDYPEITEEKVSNAEAWFNEHEGEEMLDFEFWCEGYLVTGMEGEPQPAFFIGHYYGKDFLDAVRNCNVINNCKMSKGDYIDICESGRCYMWGCRVFDNEADARKSFG